MSILVRVTTAGAREIGYEHSKEFVTVLSQLRCSLLVSTYQAGKLAVVGTCGNELTLSFHNFERAMGIAVRPDRVAVGAQRQIWFLDSAPDVAPRIPPAGRHDGCFLTRAAHFTGEIQVHELAFGGADGGELWCANTLFSCLCTLDERHNFVPRWKPPFVSALAPEDCHLNGFALGSDGRPAYVTVIAETNVPQGGGPRSSRAGA